MTLLKLLPYLPVDNDLIFMLIHEGGMLKKYMLKSIAVDLEALETGDRTISKPALIFLYLCQNTNNARAMTVISHLSPEPGHTLRVRFHLCGAVAERSPLGGADFGVSVFSCCVFPLWRWGGGAEAGVRGRYAEWVLEPFSAPPCGAVAVWRQLASTHLKYRSRYIDIKNTQH